MSAKDVGAPAKARVVHSTLSSRIGMAFWLVLTAVLVALPYWGDRQMMRLATEIYSFVALASLWNFLAGYAGLVSVGQQTFVGLGGYTLYLCALWAGLNPMLGLPLAGVIGALISVPIVLLLLKLRGAYFTIGSWVVAEVFLQIFHLVPAVGGGSGISLPATVVQSIASSRSGRESLIYWVFLALAVAVIGVIVLLLRTRYGLALQAIRDNETAAKSNGIDVNRARMVVFVVAAAATAMVGSNGVFAKAQHHAILRLQHQRLDGEHDLHHRHRWHRQSRGADPRHRHLFRAARIPRRSRQHVSDHPRRRRDRCDAQSAEGNLGLCGRPPGLAAFPARTSPCARNRRQDGPPGPAQHGCHAFGCLTAG